MRSSNNDWNEEERVETRVKWLGDGTLYCLYLLVCSYLDILKVENETQLLYPSVSFLRLFSVRYLVICLQ